MTNKSDYTVCFYTVARLRFSTITALYKSTYLLTVKIGDFGPFSEYFGCYNIFIIVI